MVVRLSMERVWLEGRDEGRKRVVKGAEQKNGNVKGHVSQVKLNSARYFSPFTMHTSTAFREFLIGYVLA
jgi:hypothetical protein